VGRNVTPVSGTYNILATDDVIVVNSVSANAQNLPAATGSKKAYTIKMINTGAVSITANGADTIDGSATAILTIQYTSVELIDYATGKWAIL
jgi:hypothetical protein